MSWTRAILMFALLVVMAGSTACQSSHLRPDNVYPDDPGLTVDEEAQIQDTPETREALEVLAQYRRALIGKDFGTLNRLISEDYYDNAGTTDTTADDYGREQLSEVFEMMARHAENIRYSVEVKDVVVKETRAHIDYEYEYAYQYRIGDEVTWDAGIEVNRLQLVKEGERWQIVSGL